MSRFYFKHDHVKKNGKEGQKSYWVAENNLCQSWAIGPAESTK